MQAPQHFGWRVDGRVATVTLDRPERKNPLTFEAYRELTDKFLALADEPDVRAIVITGAGENFSSGGDVHEIIGPLVKLKAEQRHDKLLEFTQLSGDLIKAMRACPQPIVAAIDGVCVGAGAIIAMASDLRLGTARSKVAFLFVKVGLSGADMGACAILPRLIGQGRASELLFLGRSMSGEEAERWGFYNRVVAPESLQEEAAALAAVIASGPTASHAVTKRALHEEWSMSVDDAIDYEARVQAECMQSNDFERAYHAFVKKEKPEFQGD